MAIGFQVRLTPTEKIKKKFYFFCPESYSIYAKTNSVNWHQSYGVGLHITLLAKYTMKLFIFYCGITIHHYRWYSRKCSVLCCISHVIAKDWQNIMWILSKIWDSVVIIQDFYFHWFIIISSLNYFIIFL